MVTTISAKEARDNFTDLLGSVYYGNQTIEISKKGRTFAVVISPDQYKALKDIAKEKFFTLVEEIQKANKGVDPDQVLEDVTAAVEEVRQERYEKKLQK